MIEKTIFCIDRNGDEWRFQYHNGIYYGSNWDSLDEMVIFDSIPSDMTVLHIAKCIETTGDDE